MVVPPLGDHSKSLISPPAPASTAVAVAETPKPVLDLEEVKTQKLGNFIETLHSHGNQYVPLI